MCPECKKNSWSLVTWLVDAATECWLSTCNHCGYKNETIKVQGVDGVWRDDDK